MSTAPTETTRRIGSRGRDYGYSNARIRGMRSRLLKQAFFDDLMMAPDIGAVIHKIMDTEYGPDMEDRILHGRTAAQVDEALKDNMVRTFARVMSVSNDEARRLLTTLLGRWDLFNIKTIIRGKHMSFPDEVIIDSLITVGQLTQVDAEELAKQESVKSVVDTLATWGLPFAVPLREVLPDYNENADLSVLELALDRYYYEWAVKRLKGRRANSRLARTFLSIQVDTLNLLTCLRLLSSDLPPEDVLRFFLPGGDRVTEELFASLSAMSDVDEVFQRLKRTPFGSILEQVAITYIEKGSISVFERALEDYLFRKAFATSKGDPLGIGISISYLWAKANEVTNMRIVVKGIAVGMPVERMREELIVV
ncbi:MAG: ATP synthase A1 subunit C [Coriobacteriia bacterium]|nr:ATP synthase A1 subunit C [Actinomycetota bacterium]MDZ4166391.1 ATP synthase A1 subunit C [Coriobacteriia bacterium]